MIKRNIIYYSVTKMNLLMNKPSKPFLHKTAGSLLLIFVAIFVLSVVNISILINIIKIILKYVRNFVNEGL